MRLAVTGGTGLVGRFIVEDALAAGDEVVVLGRNAPDPGAFSGKTAFRPFDLATGIADLTGCDALVHAAFSHVPGRYRGGEGRDPDGFAATNLLGTQRLFSTARQAGVSRALFLSSRAVYADYPPGTRLHEALPPRPDTLYGQVKFQAETALAGLDRADFATASLRATGVYGPAGPGQRHKWQDLFDRFARGETVDPRVATEVHGRDLAKAVRCLLMAEPSDLAGRVFNVSDIVLDRRDLLAEVKRLTGGQGQLPHRADAAQVSEMACQRLCRLGWNPGGMALLRDTLPALLEDMG